MAWLKPISHGCATSCSSRARWASDAGWSVVGVTATGDQVLVQATGPNPAPSLTELRRDLDAAGLNGLQVRVSLVPASYQPLPG